MGKKNEKRVCWHCDGDVSLYLDLCPYCGVDVNAPPDGNQKGSLAQSLYFQRDQNFASPFQTAPHSSSPHYPKDKFSNENMRDAFGLHPANPFNSEKKSEELDEFQKRKSRSHFASNEREDEIVESTKENPQENALSGTSKERFFYFLLLPGLVLFLFSLVLLLFAEDGVLTLSWSQNLAVFYFLASIPLMILGWRSFNK